MWIMIAGPSRTGASGPEARAASLRTVNEAAGRPVFRSLRDIPPTEA